jgi:N-acetylneuraminic acid mutarotase/predicted nucleic acid-binding Zn ribbon protein
MALKKCLICSKAFSGRRDAKTCSVRCRKRLQLVKLSVFSAPAKKHLAKTLVILLVGFFGILSVFFSANTPKTYAAASTYLNFQARLLNSAGNVIPDGNYNIDFKIYNADSTTGTVGSCSSSCLWEETRKNSNSQGVRVVNGYLSVKLGDVTAFPAINWDQQLWLTMNIGGTSVGASPTWDGEMQSSGHSIQLTAVPLAFAANQLATGTGSSRGTLSFAALGQATAITLPDPGAGTATVCYQNAAACGFAASSGSSSYIQNTTSLQSNANFNIQSASSSSIGGIIVGASGQSVDTFQVKADSVANPLLSVGSTGAATFRNSSDSTTAFQIQNASGANLFQVDTTNNKIVLGGNNAGDLQPWSSSANTITSSSGWNPIIANGYIYAAGRSSSVGSTFSAKIKPNGDIEPWVTGTTTLAQPINFGSEVAANGFEYVIGGQNSSGTKLSNVQYAKINADGTFGSWNSTTSLPSARNTTGAVVVNGYVYVMGGEAAGGFIPQNNVWYAKLNSDGTLGSWNSAPNLPQTLAGPATVTANGYIYIITGQFQSSTPDATNAVYYTKVNADGTIGSWNTTTSTGLPALNLARATILNGYVYVVAGFDGNNVAQSGVYYSKLNSDGTLGSWTQTTSISNARDGVAVATANGYIYAIGGTGGSTRVDYTSGERIQLGGALDLVGLSGANLDDQSGSLGQGSIGGALTAGNTNIVGTLQVLSLKMYLLATVLIFRVVLVLPESKAAQDSLMFRTPTK